MEIKKFIRIKKFMKIKKLIKAIKITQIMILSFILICFVPVNLYGYPYKFSEVFAKELYEKDISLYSTAAVLIDAQTNRVLYGKNQDTPLAMASTTKIMTCIVILENLALDEEVGVSAYAASMPKVKLYVKQGEKYTVKNLLYSMMLESHNDSAAVLAEHLGKKYLDDELKNKDTANFTTEESKLALSEFAKLMNEKAIELNCTQTYFITPNGLDATKTITLSEGETITKEHSTTAKELAMIMAYCVLYSPQKQLFREITKTPSYSFNENGRSFCCNNHNVFLSMMSGAFSGKTGFTNKAGYCYVGALERDNRTYIVALLACGWPNNRTYKWSDTKKLMEFGLENYTYNQFSPEVTLDDIYVENAASPDGNPYSEVALKVKRQGDILPISMLTCEGEFIEAQVDCEKNLTAPVEAGMQVGEISYFLVDNDNEKMLVAKEKLFIDVDVAKKDFKYVLKFVLNKYMIYTQ